MPPKQAKQAASGKDKGTKANKDNAGDSGNAFCRRVVRSPPPKLAIVDEGTKEYYLMQIRDLENRIAR